MLEVLGSQTGIPKGLKKRIGNSEVEEGLIMLGRQWGAEHFGFFEGKGGEGKVFMPPMVGYGYFLEASNPACRVRPVSHKFMKW